MSDETKEWLEKKYREWRDGRPRNSDSMERFAKHLGVSRNTLNNWMNRGQTPGRESAAPIAAALGPEIYDLLNLPRPDPLLDLIVRKWGTLSNAVQQEIAATVERAEARGVVGQGDTRVEVPKPKRKGGS